MTTDAALADSPDFLRQVIDSLTEHIVVIHGDGGIVFVNRPWMDFCCQNDGPEQVSWQDLNYLGICRQAADAGEDFGLQALEGIQQVIDRQTDLFYLEYPCHSPNEQRWFMMRVTPLRLPETTLYVISHHNITERVLAEEEVHKRARLDGLTGIANRRHLDEFLHGEWRRAVRYGQPITLAMIDIDHFKVFNDTYGHQAGDDCLIKVAGVLKAFSQRPEDLCARYGGEEFVLVFGNTDQKQALPLVAKAMDAVRDLKIPNAKAPTQPIVTISVGLATINPDQERAASDLVGEADRLLYQAKEQGRNRIAYRHQGQLASLT
ncbi:MAG: sensor domain-containing diguanylate cyclase [Desulfuromonadales bacterium]|nr:sensor domain-containing diguanylate cyclase [Desulfuromonadales bacterium]MDW7757853.1 sensor domain-containing diguanylate cyclase [Desulfuromonadales bacterium]